MTSTPETVVVFAPEKKFIRNILDKNYHICIYQNEGCIGSPFPLKAFTNDQNYIGKPVASVLADLIFEVDRAEYMSDRYKKLLDAAIDLEKRGNEMLNLKHSLESKSNK